jgi:hypothetical protein
MSYNQSFLSTKLLVLPTGKIVLVPSKDEDLHTLLRVREEILSSERLNLSTRDADCFLSVQVDSVEDSTSVLLPESYVLTTLPTPISTAPALKDKIINPKHIYKTTGDSYRIQMSTGSKFKPNKKFSRNVRSEVDALWLCEYALIVIDGPESFEDIVKNGNFLCFMQRGMVASIPEFGNRLHELLGDFESRDLIKRTEYEFIADVLQRVVPYVALPPPSSAAPPAEDVCGDMGGSYGGMYSDAFDGKESVRGNDTCPDANTWLSSGGPMGGPDSLEGSGAAAREGKRRRRVLGGGQSSLPCKERNQEPSDGCDSDTGGNQGWVAKKMRETYKTDGDFLDSEVCIDVPDDGVKQTFNCSPYLWEDGSSELESSDRITWLVDRCGDSQQQQNSSRQASQHFLPEVIRSENV